MHEDRGPKIRTLIVDDEPLARANLAVLARRDDELDVVGECADGVAALESIASLRPDVVLLDVKMPKLDGMSLMKRLEHPPLVVFVTAHADYALRAFEEGAVDYLLKPFDDARFATTIARVKERLRPSTTASHPRRILVKGVSKTLVVPVDDIDWIGGAGNYIRLHVGGHDLLHRATISEFLTQLDPSRFVRIHRSTIVNLTQVRRMEPVRKGAWLVRLVDGTELRMSAMYRDHVEQALVGVS